MKRVRLFTIVWGSPYVEWFELACAESLCWPRNREAAAGIEAWDLWTTPEDAAKVKAIAGRVGVPLDVHPDLSPETVTPNVLGSLMKQMETCVSRKAAFLFAAPDSIFGDGSVRSLLEMGQPPRVCVAAAPMRVRTTILGELKNVRSNAQLVAAGFQHMHPAFADARVADVTNSRDSGISWRPIGEGLYAVQYRTYSSYLMTPEAKDVAWFRANPRFGFYDSSFPQALIEDQRQRVVGSSDAVFVCELTPDDRRAKPLRQSSSSPDDFPYNLAHHRANRNVVCIWRAG